jgi:hypothetical protein
MLGRVMACLNFRANLFQFKVSHSLAQIINVYVVVAWSWSVDRLEFYDIKDWLFSLTLIALHRFAKVRGQFFKVFPGIYFKLRFQITLTRRCDFDLLKSFTVGQEWRPNIIPLLIFSLWLWLSI